MIVTVDDVLTSSGKYKDRPILWPVTEVMLGDADELARRVSAVLDMFGEVRKVSSGYRPPVINAKTKNAAKKSNHMVCRAVDIEDSNGMLGHWCMANLSFLVIVKLWIEHPDDSTSDTGKWIHFQTVPPASGKRVFRVK